MENIIWLRRGRVGRNYKKEDCSIRILKDNTLSIIIRNNFTEEITNTDYIKVGISSDHRTRLYFMAADKATGWKASKSRVNPSLTRTRLCSEKFSNLRKFEGDYNFEISDDNLFFIDRKKVIG